jgi:hypothetical protein
MEQRMASLHPKSLEERRGDEARMLLDEAELLPPGAVRDAVIRAARQRPILRPTSTLGSAPPDYNRRSSRLGGRYIFAHRPGTTAIPVRLRSAVEGEGSSCQPQSTL